MSKITKIVTPPHKPDRVWIHINNKFCVSIRKRTFRAMNLKKGDSITCDKLKEREKFFWKIQYGPESWKKEKPRIQKVQSIISSIDKNIIVEIVGFGAQSEEYIMEHPEEMGVPDLDIYYKGKSNIILKVEVTGTEVKSGSGYWIRPDKIEYTQSHPDEDVWIALHFARPEEYVFVKPKAEKEYRKQVKEIRDAEEIFCVFNPGDEEIHTFESFSNYLKQKIRELKN